MEGSDYGVAYLRRGIGLCTNRNRALDVGCGAGGRMVHELLHAGFDVTGLDVSARMLAIAGQAHPSVQFEQADICTWQPPQTYDLVLAWDSTFHVPHAAQRGVIEKLCRCLAPGGVLLFTSGTRDGEIHGEMEGQTLYYSSLDTPETLRILAESGCDCVLLERDQYPEEHVVVLALRRAS
jgi:trans-aconitate methyltransferase